MQAGGLDPSHTEMQPGDRHVSKAQDTGAGKVSPCDCPGDGAGDTWAGTDCDERDGRFGNSSVATSGRDFQGYRLRPLSARRRP